MANFNSKIINLAIFSHRWYKPRDGLFGEARDQQDRTHEIHLYLALVAPAYDESKDNATGAGLGGGGSRAAGIAWLRDGTARCSRQHAHRGAIWKNAGK